MGTNFQTACRAIKKQTGLFRNSLALSITIAALIILTGDSALAQDVSFYPLKFRSTNISPGVNPKNFQDSTWISFDSSAFKPLLFTTARVQTDSNNRANFKIYGPFVLMAKVGNGAYQPVWQHDSNDVVTISISKLISDTGFIIPTGGKNILVSGVPFLANRIYLSGKPSSAINNSYVSLNGTFVMPETGGKIVYALNDTNRVKLVDSMNLSPSFEASADTFFYMKYAGYQGKGLKLRYRQDTRIFSMYGKMILKLDSNDIPVQLGDSLQPGLVYKNGLVDKIAITASDTFSLFKLRFQPDNFNMYFSNSDSLYKTFGRLKFGIEQGMLAIQLGDSLNPGFIVKNNKITRFRASVIDTFNIRNLSFRPSALTFAYDTSGGKRYYIFGNLTVLLKPDSASLQDSIIATLGQENNPGLVMLNGQLQQMNLAVTSQFNLKKLKISPDSLGFNYDKLSQTYSIFGQMGISYDSVKYHINAGNLNSPGIVINNGKIRKLLVSIDDTISVRGFKIKPKQLSFKYDSTSNNSFSVFGSATAVIRGDSASAADTIFTSLGIETQPGMLVSNGQLQKLNLGLTGKFRLKKLELDADSLTFQYDRSSKWFELFGKVKAVVDSMSFNAQLGVDTNPGIVFSADKLVKLNFTVNDTITIKRLKFKPNPLTFQYDTAANNSFRLFGDAVAFLESDTAGKTDTISVHAGTQAQAGLLVKDGAIQQFNMSVSADFTLKRLYMQPKPLSFQYDKSTKVYKLFGKMKFAIESDTLDVSLGDSITPGMTVSDGKLLSLNIGISDTINIKKLKLVPRGLTFRYDGTSGKRYSMFGNLTAIIENDTISGNLGTASSPGFLYQDGQLQALNIGVTNTHFKLKGIGFESNLLVFKYDRPQSRYEIFGDVNIDFDSNHAAVGLGTDSLPGIVISNGRLTHILISVTDTFKLRGLIFEPKQLTFEYDSSSAQYEIFGSAKAIIKQDSIDLNLGNSSNPGIAISGGVLKNINVGVTTDFKMKGIGIHPKALTFYYSRQKNKFEMFGDLDIRFDGNVIDMNMGDSTQPGLAVNTLSGDLEQLNLSTTDTLKLYSLVLSPDQLTFKYDKDSGSYIMYGAVTAALGSDSVKMTLGSASNPGFEFRNGILMNLNLGITDSIKLYELGMKAKNLTCQYNRQKDRYAIFGSLTLNIGTEKIEAKLGTPSDPGIVIINSIVQDLNITVDGSFSIAGVSFTPNDVTFRYDHDSSYYEMYGTIGFNLEGDDITADLGNSSIPGFTIRHGVLYEMNIGITSDINLGGLEVQTNNVGVYFTKGTGGNPDKYVIRGEVLVKELWSISATLGTVFDPTSGLEIFVPSQGKCRIKLDAFTIEAKHVSFGGVTFNDIMVNYGNPMGGVYNVACSLDVSFPTGFEVSGDVSFSTTNGKFKLLQVDLAYDAGSSEGIEIPETEVFIVHLAGGVKLIDQNIPNDYQFTGDIGLAMGGQLEFNGITCTMMRMNGSVTIDKDHLNIQDWLYMGAYEQNNTWKGVLGTSMVELDMNWAEGAYVVTGMTEYPSPVGFVRFTSEAEYYSSGTFGALGEADLIVPDIIPIIGGKTLASVDAAVRYDMHDINNSFAAGWTDINLLVKKVTVGIEYNFGTTNVKKIGSSDVGDLKSETQSMGGVNYPDFTFNVDNYVHSVTINFKPRTPALYNDFLYQSYLRCSRSDNIDVIEILTPDNNSNSLNFTCLLAEIDARMLGLSNTADQSIVMGDYTINADSISSNGFLIHLQGNTVDQNEAITPGQYTLSCLFTEFAAYFNFEIQQHYFEPDVPMLDAEPAGDGQTVRLSNNSTVFITDTPTVTFYYHTAPEYKGSAYRTDPLSTATGRSNVLNEKFIVRPDSTNVYDSLSGKWKSLPVMRNKAYYFYSVVKDGVNRPVYSEIQGPIFLGPAVNVNVLTQNLKYTKSGTHPFVADMELSFQVSGQQTIDKNSTITVYYDFDSIGYNGYAVPGLTSVQWGGFKYWDGYDFTLSSVYDQQLTTNGIYYYTVIKTPDGKLIYQPYTPKPVKLFPSVSVNVNFNNPYGGTEAFQGITVYIDMNNNGRREPSEPDLTTDGKGNCTFDFTFGASPTIGIELPLDYISANPNIVTLKKITNSSPSGSSVTFSVNYKLTQVSGSLSLTSRNGRYINPQGNSGYWNYVFADLNRNGKREGNEPYKNNDGTQGTGPAFNFNITQPVVDLVYVSTNNPIGGFCTSDDYGNYSQYSITNGVWTDNNNNQLKTNQSTDTNNIPSYSITVDLRQYGQAPVFNFTGILCGH